MVLLREKLVRFWTLAAVLQKKLLSGCLLMMDWPVEKEGILCLTLNLDLLESEPIFIEFMVL